MKSLKPAKAPYLKVVSKLEKVNIYPVNTVLVALESNYIKTYWSNWEFPEKSVKTISA